MSHAVSTPHSNSIDEDQHENWLHLIVFCIKIDSVNEAMQLQMENVELVKRLYSAFTMQDISVLLQVLSEDIDWLFYGPDDIPFAGHYRGHEQVAGFFATALATSEFLRFEPREFLPGVNTVLVQGYEHVRAKSTGRTWETEWAHVFTLSNGKIAKLREYYDTSVIVEAFRGSEAVTAR